MRSGTARSCPATRAAARRTESGAWGQPTGSTSTGGRTHPAYGKVALVFRPLDEEEHAEVTPFGLGGLLCKGSGDGHDQRHCMAPVAHLEDAEQAAYVAASTWRSNWRDADHAAQFVALYFGANLDAYFADADTSRPVRPDPAGVFHPTTGVCSRADAS
jgi:hypothetical protein